MREQTFDTGSRLRLAQCVLDLRARELRTADDRPIELRAKALDVLLLLAEHAGRVVDKATLMERVWAGTVVGDDSLTQTIVAIRRAIGDSQRKVLCTVARRGYRLQPSEGATSSIAPPLSIAVLPIARVDTEADSERWAAMLTAELTSRVGTGLPDSKVVARETVAAAGATLADPRVAAHLLGVQQVVCGDLRAVASGWNLTLAVIDGVTGARRWLHRFALERTSLPEGIGEVAAQAARAVLVEMHRTAAAIASAHAPGQQSPADLALQGWAKLYEGLSPYNLEQAQQLFAEAVERDASNLRALSGVCSTSYLMTELGWARDRRAELARVLGAATRLQKFHPDETLTGFANCAAAGIEGKWDLRLLICARLCERDPANPSARFQHGISLLKLGRFDESIAEIEAAERLSVRDFRAGWWTALSATAHLMAGRHAQAAQAARQAIATNACLPLPPLLLAAALVGDGSSMEGREVLCQHQVWEPQCDLGRAGMLLGHGDVAYMQGRGRILSALEALGIERARSHPDKR